MLDFTLSGIEQARANLQRVVSVVNDRRIGENAAVALEPIAEEARRLVPVDSGDLRDTIGIANSLGGFGNSYDENSNRVVVGVLRAGKRDEHVFYAHFIEFGTVTQRAQPFMAPAIFKHRELVMEILTVRIGEDILEAL